MNTPASPSPLPPSHRSTRYPSSSDSRPGQSTASNAGERDELREHARRDSAYGEPILFGLDKFGLIVVSLVLTVFVGFMVSLVLIYRPDFTAHPAPPVPSVTAASAPTPTTSPTPTLSPELEAQREAAYSMAPPEENPQMFTNTDEGGAATAAYFVRTIFYGFFSGNTEATASISDPECLFCKSVQDQARENTADGSWSEPYEVTLSDIEWQPPTEQVPYGFATVTVTQPEHIFYDSAGAMSTEGSLENRLEIGMYWNGERWIVRGVVFAE